MQTERARFQIPPVERNLTKEQLFQQVINGGISQALEIIEVNFESTPIQKDRLFYHTRPHTLGVISRTQTILTIINKTDSTLVTDRDIALGRFAAAWHDTVQESEEPITISDEKGREIKRRKRATGSNEQKSADLAVSYMEDVNTQIGEVFTEEDVQKVREAILITIPGFSDTLQTVTQPNFAKYHDNLVAQAVALADLGAAAMEGITERWIADTLFVEEHPAIADYIQLYELTQHDRRLASLRDPIIEQTYVDWMGTWLSKQLEFIEGNKQDLAVNILLMNKTAGDAIQNLFTHYPEAFDEVKNLIRKRSMMTFPELVDDIEDSLRNPPLY